MKDIHINGVGYNIHSVSKKTKAEFINSRMHEQHRIHLPAQKRKEAVLEAAEILTPYFKPDGNSNTNDGQVNSVSQSATDDSEVIGDGNEGAILKSKRRAVGKGNNKVR